MHDERDMTHPAITDTMRHGAPVSTTREFTINMKLAGSIIVYAPDREDAEAEAEYYVQRAQATSLGLELEIESCTVTELPPPEPEDED